MFIHFRLAYLVERKNVKKCAQYLALDDFLYSVIGKQMTPAQFRSSGFIPSKKKQPLWTLNRGVGVKLFLLKVVWCANSVCKLVLF